MKLASLNPKRLPLTRESLRVYGVLLTLIALFIGLSAGSDSFLTKVNLTNVLSQSAPIGILACGATIVIISGGFDLSAGAIYALSGVVAAKAAIATTAWFGLAIGIAFGLLLGLINGLIVTLMRVNAFIATLATGLVFRGIATTITKGSLVRVDDSGFSGPGKAEWLTFRVSIWIFAIVAIISTFVLTRTRIGRYIRAVGGNAEASRLAGIRVDFVRVLAFTLSGVLSALAGVIAASRVSTAQADLAMGIELVAIAAVIVGGTSPAGGEGAIWRSIVGIFLLSFISNGFNLLNVNAFYLPIVQGAIILFAIGADSWAQGRIRMWRQRYVRRA